MSVFLDTSAFYALLVGTEERHAEVLDSVRSLAASRRTLWTTSYVVLETVVLMQRRIGMAPVRDFQENWIPLLTVEWVTSELHARGMSHLLREDRRRLSLVDCVSMEFLRQAGLREVVALDRHFAEAGFRLLPSG